MERLINDLTFNDNLYCVSNESVSSKVKCIRCVTFETGEKAYFTKFFKANVFDRYNESIIEKSVEELKQGDELIFVRNERDMERDIVIEIVNKLLNNEQFNYKYNIMLELSKYWKKSLKEFMDKNNFDEVYISRQLQLYNCPRDPITISLWIKSNKIIGPVDKEVYKAIAMITEDIFLLENWENVYEACNLIRKLHTRIKKYLANSIIKSVTGLNKEEIWELEIIKDSLGELSDYAQIVQIENIFDLDKELPIHLVNKLIEM